MHCPTCRHDNPATTRFCSECGAVLVESAPDGRRRRVLRPWGLRRSAPPTISPDMPDLLVAEEPGGGTRLDPSARIDLWIVAGLVVAVVAATWLNGKVRAATGAAQDAVPAIAAGAPAYVTATAPPIVQEARLKAPPLVDVPPPQPSPAATSRATGEASRAAARAAASVPVAAVAIPSEPPRDEVRAEAPVVVAAAPSPSPAPVVDRWQPLRSALAQCGAVDGAFARAMCEQGARLAHCEGYWGLVPPCPVQRTEYGQ